MEIIAATIAVAASSEAGRFTTIQERPHVVACARQIVGEGLGAGGGEL